MAITEEQILAWRHARENEHLEFKAAERNFDFDDLARYCAALANEGGGSLVLGITDGLPRHVVGTIAFAGRLEEIRERLLRRIQLRIETSEVLFEGKRVLVFEIPSHPVGIPVVLDREYLARSGASLVGMTPSHLHKILDEGRPDFSAEICPGAALCDLAPEAVALFQTRWAEKSKRPDLTRLTQRQVLQDSELVAGDSVTYAALVLFGTREAVGRFLAQAEVIFEYRSDPASIRHQQRKEYRQGFFIFQEDLERTVEEHNDLQHFQEGFFLRDIPTFDLDVAREAILNAVAHRDYRLQGSVFVRTSPRQMEVISPGGFPQGVTAENILDRSVPRNRRIADALAKCGLVERGGQGMDLMYRRCIESAKALPDFSGTDNYQVRLCLEGTVQDARVLRFLEEINAETLATFSVKDLLLLNCVLFERRVPAVLREGSARLVQAGIVESVGRKLIPSRRFHAFLGKKGTYTRRKGLDRQTNKELLLRHIRENAKEGSPRGDLQQVLPSLSVWQVQTLLREMRESGLVRVAGKTRGGRWYPLS